MVLDALQCCFEIFNCVYLSSENVKHSRNVQLLIFNVDSELVPKSWKTVNSPAGGSFVLFYNQKAYQQYVGDSIEIGIIHRPISVWPCYETVHDPAIP